jgi:hypothetical protein
MDKEGTRRVSQSFEKLERDCSGRRDKSHMGEHTVRAKTEETESSAVSQTTNNYQGYWVC